MFKTIRTAVLSALIGIGTLAGATAASTTSADAASITIGFNHHGTHIGYRHGHRPHGYDYGYRRGHCDPYKAVSKARHMGLHRAHVRYANHRVVAVSGRKWGHYKTILFANQRWCPVIR